MSRWGDRLSAGCWSLSIAIAEIASGSLVLERRLRAKGEPMKKGTKKIARTEMLPEYDFSRGARGKYATRYAEGSNIVVLSPDVAKLFPDSESVNRALRACGEIIRSQQRRKVGS